MQIYCSAFYLSSGISVKSVHGSKDDLINRLFIHDVPLNSLRTLENLFDYGSVAGIGEGG